jgi:hypothetical protein
MSPIPSVTVPVGATLVVTVPPWHWGDATDVHVDESVLSERCSVLLKDRGRRVVLFARDAGESGVAATVMPGSNLMMPAWMGKVIVQGKSSSPRKP